MDTAAALHPDGLEASPKSYGRAVALSAVLGFAGVQHLYLGRPALFFLDLGLSFGWIVCFAIGETALGATLLLADMLHALIVTIQLLTGSFCDGRGRIVCYPGQKLGTELINHEMRTGPS
jgi:hypothetical protein